MNVLLFTKGKNMYKSVISIHQKKKKSGKEGRAKKKANAYSENPQAKQKKVRGRNGGGRGGGRKRKRGLYPTHSLARKIESSDLDDTLGIPEGRVAMSTSLH